MKSKNGFNKSDKIFIALLKKFKKEFYTDGPNWTETRAVEDLPIEFLKLITPPSPDPQTLVYLTKTELRLVTQYKNEFAAWLAITL